MKKLCIFIGIFIILTVGLWGQNYTWNGTNGNWNDNGNWAGGNIFPPNSGPTENLTINCDVNPNLNIPTTIAVGGNLTITGGTALTLDGVTITVGENATFRTNMTVGSVSVTGTSDINANITTTGTAGQTYTGQITLGNAAVTLNAGAANPVRMGLITGGGYNLTITGIAAFNGSVSGIGILLVNQASSIYNNISTTGNQTYTGNSTLYGNINFASTGGIVRFTGTVNRDNTPRTITVTGNARFIGNVGTITNRFTSISVSGTTRFGSINGTALTIYTTGNQTYSGAVTLSRDTTIDASIAPATVTFINTISGYDGTPRSLTITAPNIEFRGAVGAVNGLNAISNLILSCTVMVSQTARIVCTQLGMSGDGGTYNLTNQDNDAANIITTGTVYPKIIDYRDTNSFNIEAGNTLRTSLGTGNYIKLQAGGTGTVNGTGSVYTQDLILIGNGNTFTLDNANNNVVSLKTQDAGTNLFPQVITYTDTNGFTIGTVPGDSLRTTTSITLQSGGTVDGTNNAYGSIITGALTLSGNNTTYTLTNAANSVTSIRTVVVNNQYPSIITYTDVDGFNIANNQSLQTTTSITLQAGGTGQTVNGTGSIITGALTLSGNNTIYTLTNAANHVTSIRTEVINTNQYPQTITYTDTGGFRIGTVNTHSLQTTTTGRITLQAGGEITQTGNIVTGLLNVTSTGAISLNNITNNAATVNLTKNTTANAGIVYNSNVGAGTLTVTAINNAAATGTISIREYAGNIIIPTSSNPAIHTATEQAVVDITAFGSITVNGNIGNNTGNRNGRVTLRSDNNINITLNNTSNINCYSFNLTTGTSNINTNINTTGEQRYSCNVMLGTNNVTLSTFGAGGNIFLEGKLNSSGSARNITFAAEAGNIEISGSVGDTSTLGDITVDNANNVIFREDVRAVNFKQNKGTGTTTFNGPQTYTGIFSFTGNALTVNNTLTTNGRIDVNNNSTFTVGNSGSILPSSANGVITVTGNTVNNGKITAAPVTAPAANGFNAAIYFEGNYTSNASGELIGSGTTTPDIQFGSDVTLGIFTQKDNRIVFATGNSSTHKLSIANPVTPFQISVDVIIRANNTVNVLANNNFRQADNKSLILENSAVFDISGDNAVTSASWHMGGSEMPAHDFAGICGNLELGPDSKIISNHINFLGAPGANTFYVHNNAGRAFISAKGDVYIQGVMAASDPDYDIDTSLTYVKFDVTTTYPLLVLEMSGSAAYGSGSQKLTTGQPLGSFHVEEGSNTILTHNLSVRGEVEIHWPGVLNAGPFNIILYACLNGTKSIYGNVSIARWKIIKAPETISGGSVSYYSMNAFVQNPNGEVIFRKVPLSTSKVFFEISGNTVWRIFRCRESGSFIQFSRHPDQHIVLDLFSVKGIDGNNITVTRLIEDNDPKYPNGAITYDPSGNTLPPGTDSSIGIDPSLPKILTSVNLKSASEEEKNKFWNFNLVTPNANGSRLLDIEYLTIFFSHAWNQRVPIDQASMHLEAIPFFRKITRVGYFNYDWVQVRRIIYNFAEDGNGNGKLDRIRVQTNVSINADFSEFKVNVEGYEVDETKGTTSTSNSAPSGFDVVENFTKNTDDGGSFYIFLKEKPYLYDGEPVVWNITENKSLMDVISQELLVGNPESGEVYSTINTIPPRVSHAVTIPGHKQTFVQISQPVWGIESGKGRIAGNEITDAPHTDYGHDKIPAQPNYTFEYYPFDSPAVLYPLKNGISEGVSNYLIPLNRSPGISSLADLKEIGGDPTEYFTLKDLQDLGVRALDWRDMLIDDTTYLYYPSPRYPLDWNYSNYEYYSGNSHVTDSEGNDLTSDSAVGSNPDPKTGIFLPPNRMLTVDMMRRLEEYANENLPHTQVHTTAKVKPSDFYVNASSDIVKRRITDVLVSITPVASGSVNYFAWPVWARNKNQTRYPGPNPAGNFWGQKDSDSGIIWQFDGTKYLEDDNEGIVLQARINSRLSGFTGLSIFYGFNVDQQWRASKDSLKPAETGSRGKIAGDLWLAQPSTDKNALFNLVPSALRNFNTGQLKFYSAVQKTPVTASSPLFNFEIAKSDGGYSSGGKIDFLLRLEGKAGIDPYLFIAWLDAPKDANLNNIEWWKMIRPFSFDIQNVRLQRGGVTILNNVINSNKREITYIRYHLVRPGRVTLQVYTLEGTLVKSIRRNEYREIGEWTDTWDGTNNGGRPVARGMYFVRIVAPDIDEIRKVMVVK